MKKQSNQKRKEKRLPRPKKLAPQTIYRAEPAIGALRRLLEIQPDILAIGPEKSLDEVLTTIAETANSLLGGNFSIVFPYDHASDQFLVAEVRSGGIPEAKEFTWGEPRPTGASRTILRDGEMIIGDYGDPEYIKKYPFLKERVADGQRLGAYQDIAPVRATLGVRLRAGEEYFGALVVNYPEPHEFQQSEIDVARIFASQAAIAIRNARIYDRYRALINVAESFSALRAAQDPKETLEKIANSVHKVLGSDLTVIFPYNQNMDVFQMERLVAVGQKVKDYKFDTPRANGGTRKVLKENILIAYNLEDAPKEWKELLGSGQFVKHFEIQAVVAVPLRVADDAVGVLYVNYEHRHRFDQAELDLIEAFSNQVALILFNTSVFEREQKERKLAETLQEVAADLIQAANLQEALEHTLEQVEKVVPYDGALFMLAEGSRLVSKAVKGFEFPNEVLKFSLDPAEDIIFREHGHKIVPVILSDASTSPRWKPVPTVEWVKGWLGIRLYSRGGDVIGEIGLYSRKKGFYSQTEAEILQAFTNQAVLAIENARFLEELRIVSDIQRKVAERSTDLDSVINTILVSALSLVGANIGQVLLLEEDGMHLTISASTSPEDVGRPDLTIEDSITGLAIKTGKPVLISDIKNDPKSKELYKPPTGYDSNSELAVPLYSEERVIGVLNVESREFNAFSQHHQDLLSTLGSVTASAIETAKSSVRELKLIEQVQEIILRGSFELKEVFDLIAESARGMTNADTSEIWMLEGEDLLKNEAIVPKTYAGSAMKTLEVQNSVNGMVVLTRLPQLIKDTQKVQLYQKASGVEMRSELCVPLIVNDKAIGTINVEALQVNAFTRHQQYLLQTLAEQAAVAIQSARQQQEQMTITEIQRELLSAAFDHKHVLDLILRHGLDLIGATLGQVLVIEKDRLLIRSSTRDEDVGSHVEIGDSVTGIAIKEKRTVRVKDVTSEEPFKKVYKPFLGLDIHSELVVPLFIGDEVIGALNVEDERVGTFTEQDQKLLETLAQQAALTLRMAEAFGVVERLHDIQDGILSEKYTVERASDEILRVAQQLIGVETGQILLLDEKDRETLIIKASTNPQEVNVTRVKVGDSVSGMAIEQRKPVIVADIKTQEPYKSRYKQFLGGDMHSELVVPLRVGENIIGVVNVESPRIGAFTQRHADILSTLAGQAAMAFRIAEQIELKKKTSEIDKNLSAGQIIHRLTGRAAAIRNWAEALREMALNESLSLQSNEVFTDAIEDIILKSENILSLVKEYKQSITEIYEARDVIQLIETAIQKTECPDNVSIEKIFEDDLPNIRATSVLSDVFWNILTNAIFAMPDGGVIKISAKYNKDQNTITISFKDSGPGIPKELHEAIFEPNFSGRKGGHGGLGLYWSRAFVKAINGEIILDGEGGKGACFSILLPAL